MLPAKVEHFLRLGNAADVGAGEAAAAHDQAERGDAQGFLGRADECQVSVEAKQAEVLIDVVLGRDRIEDEVEAAGLLLHLAGVARDDGLVGAQTERIFLLVGRSREDDDVGAEGAGELDAHVTQPPRGRRCRPSSPG